MYVKALRLAGFKSFADPTILEFEPGVNVIVGPNGSGKSNIADALSWVLGSQAPSSLRGASMEDVIFAGAEGRTKLGMAEVQLTLDNADRALPIDLNEVTIARSTDRAGQSEYKINGAPCRLLDIAELLSDTGIGRSIHTVVGQGQLDTVLHARPEDRRDFIEEAAQIGKYRRRKDRSLRKIERVDENLIRLNDVLSELKRAIRPLKRQASAAAAYSELMARHRELRQRLASTELDRIAREEAQVDPEVEARRAELLGDELASIRARLESSAAEREALAQASEDATQTYYRLGRAADRLGSLGRIAQERAARIAVRLASETEEGYRERIRLLEEDAGRWRTDSASLREAAEGARTKAAAAASAAETARSRATDAERELSRKRAEETAAAQALIRAEGREAAGKATVGGAQARVQSLIERRQLLEQSSAATSTQLTAAEQEVATVEAELDRATEAAAAAETALEAARERAERLKERAGIGHAQAAAATARLEALEEVVELLRDQPVAVARLEQLVDRALDSARVATGTEDEARSLAAAAENDAERLWQDVARHDEELRRLDALASGSGERLAGARRQLEAREIELAALNDELARAEEVLAGAERDAIEERAELPARRADVEETRSARESAEAHVAEARKRAADDLETSTRAELDARGAEERALAAQLRVEEAETGIADAHAALAGLEDLRSSLREAQKKAQLVATIALEAAERAEAWAAEAEVRADAAREEARVGEERVNDLRSRERELAEKLEEVGRRRSHAEVRRAETRARSEAIGERAMEEWGLDLDAMRRFEVFDATEEVEARAEAEKLERDMRRLGAVNPHAAEEYAELAEREKFLQGQIDDLMSSRRDLMKIVHEIDATIVEVFREAFESVAREFEQVFDRLFPGGTGRLKLLDPDNLLTSGIDIEAKPAGKNVRKMSLLSGGERSLVALAFLFAIFRSRPSPFYLMDEVEAALDDVNLQRFLGLIDELESHAQVLIVTHQKRTMEAADILYGVTMGKDGVSRVVAKRMEGIESV